MFWFSLSIIPVFFAVGVVSIVFGMVGTCVGFASGIDWIGFDFGMMVGFTFSINPSLFIVYHFSSSLLYTRSITSSASLVFDSLSIFSASGILILSSQNNHSIFSTSLSTTSGVPRPRTLSNSLFISCASDCSFLSLFKSDCCCFISPCLSSSFATVPGLSPTFQDSASLVALIFQGAYPVIGLPAGRSGITLGLFFTSGILLFSQLF